MARRLEFFFDYGSPYSYVANAQLPALCARAGATLVYRPMLLGGVFKATGNRSPAAEPIEPKRRYGGAHPAALRAPRRAWPFRPNPHFPIDTLFLMRCAVAAQHARRLRRLPRARVSGVLGRGSGPRRSARCWPACSPAPASTPSALFEAALQPEVKAELRATTDEAVARGAFGAPTFFVGDELFFGSDHLRFAAARARGDSGLKVAIGIRRSRLGPQRAISRTHVRFACEAERLGVDSAWSAEAWGMDAVDAARVSWPRARSACASGPAMHADVGARLRR